MRPLAAAVLLLCFGLLSPATATEIPTSGAAPQIYLWAIKQGCSDSPQRTEAVRRHLTSLGYRVTPIQPAVAWPSCQADSCVELLHQQCPAARPGVLLGGQVEERNRVIRVRLWLYDYAAQKSAFQDGFCDQCELDETVAHSSSELLERPRFEPPPGPLPQYCSAESGANEPPPPPSHFYYLARGESRQRLAHQALLGEVLRVSGIGSELVSDAERSLELAALNRITAAESRSRVLWSDSPSDGKIVLWTFDRASQASDSIVIDCPSCTPEALQKRLRSAAELLIDRCLGSGCTPLPTPQRRPPAACLPFASCGGGGGLAASSAADSFFLGERGLARAVKGSLWGLVATGAITTAALLAAQYSGAGSTVDASGARTSSPLLPAIGVSSGATLLLLGAAIPLTVALDRAESRSPQHGRGNNDLRCPN